jgi:hypothetical protein
MKRKNEPDLPAVVLKSHPPERLIRAMARGEVAACCCCGACCSCCCLHSLASLAGAVVGTYHPADRPGPGAKKAPPAGLRDDELDEPADAALAELRPRLVVTPIFWRTAAALAVLTILVLPTAWAELNLPFGILMLILFLPGVLLCGSAISALVIAGHPTLRGDIREWKRLGWITLGIVAGALVGVLLMLPLALR